jgi:hypothetical protein
VTEYTITGGQKVIAIQPTVNIGWYFDGKEETTAKISFDIITDF